MMRSETKFGNENQGIQIGTLVNQHGMALPIPVQSLTESGQKAVG